MGDGHHAAVADACPDYLQRAGLAVRRIAGGGQVTRLATTGSGGRRLRPSHQPGPRSPSPHPSGGGQRGPGCRREVVGGGQQAGLRPRVSHPVRLPCPPARRADRATRCGLGGAPLRTGGRGGRRSDAPPCLFAAVIGHRRVLGPSGGTGWQSGAVPRGLLTPPGRTRNRSTTVDSLAMAEWKERAADFGFDLGDLTRVVGRAGTARSGPVVDKARVCRRLEQLGQQQRSLAHRDVVVAIAGASSGGTRIGQRHRVAGHGPHDGCGRGPRRPRRPRRDRWARTPGGGPDRGAEVGEPRRSAVDLAHSETGSLGGTGLRASRTGGAPPGRTWSVATMDSGGPAHWYGRPDPRDRPGKRRGRRGHRGASSRCAPGSGTGTGAVR